MTKKQPPRQAFNILIVGQSGRLQYEALLFAASLRHCSPNFDGELFVAEPQAGPNWSNNPAIQNVAVLEALDRLDVRILPFESKVFGQSYPQGNKIEALFSLPPDKPFIFFDTDTLITGDIMTVPFDFERPGASLRCEGTWPIPTLYGPQYGEIWKSLYDKFGLDFDSSLDLGQPDEFWKRYLYFNAGWFFGACPKEFGEKFLSYALAIRDDRPDALVIQSLDPWLDQVALPLVIHALGGGRHTIPSGLLDGETSCHYRLIPLLYAREADHVVDKLEEIAAPNKLKKLLKQYDPFKRMIYQKRGRKARALFDQANLPKREAAIRNTLKRNGFWMR